MHYSIMFMFPTCGKKFDDSAVSNDSIDLWDMSRQSIIIILQILSRWLQKNCHKWNRIKYNSVESDLNSLCEGYFENVAVYMTVKNSKNLTKNEYES